MLCLDELRKKAPGYERWVRQILLTLGVCLEQWMEKPGKDLLPFLTADRLI